MLNPPPALKRTLARFGNLPLMQPLVGLLARMLAPRHRIAVFVVVLDHESRILLLRHVLHPVLPWGLPGGWLCRNESPREGALRELREETGLELDPGPVVYISHQPEPWHVTIVFLAHAADDPPSLGAEIVESQWFAPGELPEGTPPFVGEAVSAAVLAARRPDDRTAVPQ